MFFLQVWLLTNALPVHL
uniref:Uncharacterized protein n=1 Tax=Anguilla anguilla TaxID=7936 RepID=A0A0E9PP80_ANGAN